MATAQAQAPAVPVEAFVLDLDGLLLDTETLCFAVATDVLAAHGAILTKEAQRASIGRRPLDAWVGVHAACGLGDAVTPAQLLAESEELLSEQWATARLLPGALRLLQHLKACGARVAIATSTPRGTFDKKLRDKPHLRQLFQASVCGDEVERGKPAPDAFLAAARALGCDPRACVCLEDAPSGVDGAVAAGMRVVVVPSIVEEEADKEDNNKDKASSAAAAAAEGGGGGPGGGGGGPGAVVEVLPSLLAFDPTRYGLPPFGDLLPGGVIPVEPPLTLAGPVVEGFGRGSKDLGIPTANVDADALRSSLLAEAVTGIYAGWASIGASGDVHPMVMSIGWNPHFKNAHKTAEPWVLADFDAPFYGQEIRLLVNGYIRPEQAFTSLEALVARIHADADAARLALAAPALQAMRGDPFLAPGGPQRLRISSSGGARAGRGTRGAGGAADGGAAGAEEEAAAPVEGNALAAAEDAPPDAALPEVAAAAGALG